MDNVIGQANTSISMDLAHRRFGHSSDERLKHISESTEGIRVQAEGRQFCGSCTHGKLRKPPFPQERRTKPNKAFEVVSSDLKGPFLVSSKEG
jgi:hypothetical protein